MKIKWLFIFFVCSSCGVNLHQEIVGNQFVFQNKERTLSINFISNDTLIIDNFFDCNIDNEYKRIRIISKYRIKKNIINVADSEEVNFPFIENDDCFFLSEKYRKRKKRFYPGGELVNDNDLTLFELPKLEKFTVLNDSTLIFFKEINLSKSIGFTFLKSKKW